MLLPSECVSDSDPNYLAYTIIAKTFLKKGPSRRFVVSIRYNKFFASFLQLIIPACKVQNQILH